MKMMYTNSNALATMVEAATEHEAARRNESTLGFPGDDCEVTTNEAR